MSGSYDVLPKNYAQDTMYGEAEYPHEYDSYRVTHSVASFLSNTMSESVQACALKSLQLSFQVKSRPYNKINKIARYFPDRHSIYMPVHV